MLRLVHALTQVGPDIRAPRRTLMLLVLTSGIMLLGLWLQPAWEGEALSVGGAAGIMLLAIMLLLQPLPDDPEGRDTEAS